MSVHSGRTSTLVAAHPTPGYTQKRRVTHQVEQVVEALASILYSPTVQFGLDFQYSITGLFCLGPRSADIHRRPPVFPVPHCATCCLPSPCKRLSRSRTTTEAPSLAKPHSGQRAAPITVGLGSVPTFTMNRLTGEVPSFSPATSPWVRRRHSPRPLLRWVSHLPRVAVGHISDHVRCVPTLIHQVWVGGPLKGVPSLVHFGLHHSVLLARRGVSGGATPLCRCRGCFHLPLRSQGQAASSFNGLLRQPVGGSLHPTRFSGASWRTMPSAQA